jgi:DNA repair exonuclease SbcCD ATPase subunit
MKERIYRIVREKCSVPYVGLRWALVVTVIAASVTVGIALAQERPARLDPPQSDQQSAAERRERQVLTERMTDLSNQAHELKARMGVVRAELAELQNSGKGESDEAQVHRAELHELEQAIAPVEREIQGLEGELHGRQMHPEADREHRREMLRRLEELGHETEMVLQALAEQNFGRNEEAVASYGLMRELNEQMQQVRQQLGWQIEGPGRQRREFGREGRIEEKIMQMEELRERARQIELELKEIGDGNPERAEKLHAELREIHDTLARVERELGSSREQGNMRQMRMRELQEQAQMLEHRLQELGGNHPDEAQELRMHLDQIHQQMETIEHEPYLLTPLFPIEEQMQPGDELRRGQLMDRRQQLRAQLGELELVFGELNRQGKGESEEAQMRRKQLHELQEQLQATENEIHQSEPGRAQEPEREKLEREVQDLRKQMDNVNEQMGEIRELIKRLLEKSEPSKAG